ncbi:hypothetical protein [Pseudonocardia acidicola]|uniref:Nitrile hydratase subunit alpha n=1 Tax=Pseudonocardia acidicola TaxID=2724939 RepID=A0ABX1SFX0_9PSEU|nr:hypothetical protein [Pseudonocardia acidicola]NMH99990.1 nitrile hydratase subunit alpha [Pseudonocardia acidicola]
MGGPHDLGGRMDHGPVWDSSAEARHLVLSERPAGSEACPRRIRPRS